MSQHSAWCGALLPKSYPPPPAKPRTTSFSPVPDARIIGRRHHITEPDKIIAAYRASAGAVRTIPAIAGFELYMQEADVAVQPEAGAARGAPAFRSGSGR
jgi:hypothetical protein